jgi:dienelactone hydrolase
MLRFIPFCLFVLLSTSAFAEVRSKKMTYKVGDQEHIGYLAWDDSVSGPRPGVLVVHEWWGLNDYARGRADQLAKLGYVAFCADMYGDGKVAKHPEDAGKMAGEVRKNIDQWRKRAIAALDVLKSQPQCDKGKVAAIGYCFGGSTCLVLAYSGADLRAVATFHAALPVPTAEEAKRIKPTILVNHGAEDKFIPDQTIKAFKSRLEEAKAPYEFVAYPGAVHSFTVPDADKHGNPGMKYDKAADEKSWAAMRKLFAEKLDK